MGYITEKGPGKYADYYSEQVSDLKSSRHSALRQAESYILLSLSRSKQYKEILLY